MTDLSSIRPAHLTMEDDPAFQIVRLTNVGDKPWSDKFLNRPYAMEPGQEIVVPYLAMCLWLGHPDAMDHPTDPQKMFRFEEYRRLQVRYGSYDNTSDGPEHKTNIPPWKDVIPRITVQAMDGTPLITVIDDPEGKHLAPAVQTNQSVELMQETIAKMQRQMQAMEERLATEQRAADSQAVADDVRTDERITPEATPAPAPERDADTPPGTGVPPAIPTAPPAVAVDEPGPGRPKVIG